MIKKIFYIKILTLSWSIFSQDVSDYDRMLNSAKTSARIILKDGYLDVHKEILILNNQYIEKILLSGMEESSSLEFKLPMGIEAAKFIIQKIYNPNIKYKTFMVSVDAYLDIVSFVKYSLDNSFNELVKNMKPNIDSAENLIKILDLFLLFNDSSLFSKLLDINYQYKPRKSHTIEGQKLPPLSNIFDNDTMLGIDKKNVIVNKNIYSNLHSSRRFEFHEKKVLAARFSPMKDMVASLSEDGALLVWDPISMELKYPMQRLSLEVKDVIFTHDGKRLSTVENSGYSARILHLDALERPLIYSLNNGKNYFASYFSPDDRFFVTIENSGLHNFFILPPRELYDFTYMISGEQALNWLIFRIVFDNAFTEKEEKNFFNIINSTHMKDKFISNTVFELIKNNDTLREYLSVIFCDYDIMLMLQEVNIKQDGFASDELY